ncbi:19474_t:CDS:2 [Funneliformis geosporum]|uniref:19474_t:CDS:1 n=1 Tax=Funneliformis geosporum TaxID=1117311 RepID=A0A9W4X519_9GLOM|nr:19474_t:CDS:2 [Funneliformis geosporum]
MSRSLKKELFVNEKLRKKIEIRLKKIAELEKQGGQRNEIDKIRNTPIRVWCRSSTIFPEMTGFTIEIYNGKKFFSRQIVPNMSGHKLGVFAPTRQSGQHGKAALKKDKEEKYQKVLEKELKIVEKLNYVDYLLTFSDAVNYLRNKNIVVGPGRGSAVSSLVVYLLGITSIDPLQHKLFFERFLNEKRKVSPDIDLDVENQNEIFNYLQQKYPKKQVARIITKEKIGWKNAFKEAGKVCKIGEFKLKEIISVVGKNSNLSNNLKLQNLQLRHPVLFALTEKISNLYYNSGIHPAGVIIAENSLVGLVPLKLENNYLLTLFEAEKLNHLGLRKYDFLSLKETFSFINFSFIREVKEFLKFNLPNYQDLDFQDKKTWELFNNFLLTDVFQLDTPSARELLIRFQPQTFSDLIIFLGLNRPGARKRAQEISQVKATKKTLDFTSPTIKEILAETYGFIIFEEQISQILAFVYDYSFSEAELKRRELTEKGITKDFLDQAKKKLTFSESNSLYRQINSAFGYTFNKAHAVAYGYLTYYVAYLKANFFPEIITHLLNEKKEKNLLRLREAFFYGFLPQGPDINYSEIGLLEERQKGGAYKNWENFLSRTVNYWEKIESSVFESWVKSGLFASMQVDTDSLLENREAIFRYLRIRQKILSTSSNLPFLDLPTANQTKRDKALINQGEHQKLSLKSEFKIHSLMDIFTKIEEYNNQETVINVYAIISQIEKKEEVSTRNASSENNYILLLQDIRNSFKLNINPEVYQTNKEILINHNELLFTLKIEVKKPSAGTGNFLEAIREISKTNSFISKKILAFDIEPKSDQENIIKTNFLTLD